MPTSFLPQSVRIGAASNIRFDIVEELPAEVALAVVDLDEDDREFEGSVVSHIAPPAPPAEVAQDVIWNDNFRCLNSRSAAGDAEKKPPMDIVPPSLEQGEHESDICGMILRAAILVIGLGSCGFASWAAVTGKLAAWVEMLQALPYLLTCIIIVAALVLMNMPFGYGYSVVSVTSGLAFGWRALPPVIVGGTLLGPWAAFLFNSTLLFRGRAPEDLVQSLPNASVKRWVKAVLVGVRQDRCSVIIVIATRCSPFAMGLQHLVLCAAGVPFLVHATGMFIGGIPSSVLSIYVGTLVMSATEEASDTADGVKLGLIVAQVVACVALMLMVSLAARRMLKKYDRPEQ